MGYEIFEGIRALHYDKNIRILFPQYEFLLNLIGPLFNLELESKSNQKLLIVGSGTGAEIEHIHKYIPTAHMTGVDISPEMQKIAEAKLIKSIPSESYELFTGKVDNLPRANIYNGATLLLVLHFLPDDGTKLKLLEGINLRLQSTARLVIADIHDNNGEFNYNLELLRAYLIAQGKDTDVVYQLTEHFKTQIFYSTEVRLHELLLQAGFNQVRKIFQSTIYGAWVAQKS